MFSAPQNDGQLVGCASSQHAHPRHWLPQDSRLTAIAMARRLFDCSARYVLFSFAHLQIDFRPYVVLQCLCLALLSF